MTGILDLIDAAVSDWETGPDAVRYNGTPKADGVVLSNPVLRFGNGPAIPAINFGLTMAPIVEHIAAMCAGLRVMNERLAGFTINVQGPFAQLARALGITPHHAGPGAPPCACHPAPFPAAHDYRRRTKHRNRRRR